MCFRNGLSTQLRSTVCENRILLKAARSVTDIAFLFIIHYEQTQSKSAVFWVLFVPYFRRFPSSESFGIFVKSSPV